MQILNTHYNILFSRIPNLRNRFIPNHENKLLSEFMPCQILPIPDEASPDIPRIFMTSKSNHSNLQVSMIGSQFSTFYDNKYNRDIKKCREYLQHRAHIIYDLIDGLNPERILTQGFVVQFIFEDLKEPVMDFLSENNSIIKAGVTLHDIEYRFSIIKDKKYFVNIGLVKAPMDELNYFDNQLTQESFPPVQQNNLLISLEINDRKLYNDNVNGYNSKEEMINNLLDDFFSMISDRICNLIRLGGSDV